MTEKSNQLIDKKIRPDLDKKYKDYQLTTEKLEDIFTKIPVFTAEEKKILMKEGDICVFYTDGVTESRSSSGEEFGYERLLEVVDKNKHRTAEEIKESIIQSVWRYTDAQGYHDDLTVFVVKWLGK